MQKKCENSQNAKKSENGQNAIMLKRSKPKNVKMVKTQKKM